MFRVILPFHLRTLAHVGSEVTLEVTDSETRRGRAAPGLVQDYPSVATGKLLF